MSKNLNTDNLLHSQFDKLNPQIKPQISDEKPEQGDDVARFGDAAGDPSVSYWIRRSACIRKSLKPGAYKGYACHPRLATPEAISVYAGDFVRC